MRTHRGKPILGVAALLVAAGLLPENWQSVGQPVTGDGAEIEFTQPVSPVERARFYRVQVVP